MRSTTAPARHTRGQTMLLGFLAIGLRDLLGVLAGLVGFGFVWVGWPGPTQILSETAVLLQQVVVILTAVACGVGSLGILFTNFKQFKKEHLEQGEQVVKNTTEVAAVTAELARVKAEREAEAKALRAAADGATAKAARAHQLAHEIARESDRKNAAAIAAARAERDAAIDALKAENAQKVAAAVELARAERAAEIDALKAELLKHIRHTKRDIENEIHVVLEAHKLLTPDPDATAVRVVVENDQNHPVPTRPAAGAPRPRETPGA